MAEHVVTIKAPELEIGKADFEFKVFQNSKLLGTLCVSHGAPSWRKRGGQKKSITWEQLAAAFTKEPRKPRKNADE